MVYVDPKNLGYAPYWIRWLGTRPETEQEILQTLYNKYVTVVIDFVMEGVDGTNQEAPLKSVVSQSNLNMLSHLCYMFDAIMPLTSEVREPIDEETMECIYVQCIYCSIGASLVEDSRVKFDVFMKKTIGFVPVEDTQDKPANTTQIPTSKPFLYDYFFDMEKLQWIAWAWLVPEYIHNRMQSFTEILVPTVDTVRVGWVLNLMNNVSDFQSYCNSLLKIKLLSSLSYP